MGKLIRKIKDKFESDNSHDKTLQGTHETNLIPPGQIKSTFENPPPPQLTDEGNHEISVTHNANPSVEGHPKLSESQGIPENVAPGDDVKASAVEPDQINPNAGVTSQDQAVPLDTTTDHTATVTRKDTNNNVPGTAPTVTTAGRAGDLKTDPVVEMRVDPEDESKLQFNTKTGRHPLEQQAFEAACGSGNQDYDGDANSQSSNGGIITQIKAKIQGKDKKDPSTDQGSDNSLPADEIVTSSEKSEEPR